MLDELRADDEVPLDLGVDDEVDIALAVAGLLCRSDRGTSPAAAEGIWTAA